MIRLRIRTLTAGLSILILVSLFLLAGCGQDTPLTTDFSAPLNAPLAGAGTAVNGATPGTQSNGTPTLPFAASLNLPLPTEDTGLVVSPSLPGEPIECMPAVDTSQDFPSVFAPNFPVPPGLLLSKFQMLESNQNYMQLVAYVPLSLNESVRFVLDRLPAAGYSLGAGDSEHGEADTTFNGNGWHGGLRIATLFDCPLATEWVIVVIKR